MEMLDASRFCTRNLPAREAIPERCDGGAGAYSATKESLAILRGGCPPQRAAFRHPRTAICVPLRAAASRMAWTRRSDTAGTGGHVPFGGLRLGAIADAPPGNGRSGTPGSRAISLSFQAPVVCP